jgi:hypothetical protein
MKRRLAGSLVIVIAIFGVAVLMTSAQDQVAPITAPEGVLRPFGNPVDPPAPKSPVPTPLNLVAIIPVPGNPIASTDIVWTDQLRGRVYLTDRSNMAIDIFDAFDNVYVGRIPGFVGPTGVVGTGGPDGVVVTDDNQLWAGDGDGKVQVADLNLDPPSIIRTVVTGPVTEGRADELGYDPLDRIILIATPGANPRYATFISADSYQILGKVTFPDATGLEQPAWDPQLHRFLLTVPAPQSYVAVIDPLKMTVTKKFSLGACGATGLFIAPSQLAMASCGKPIIFNAIDGHIITTITQVNGGDEIWYNNGDGRLYVTGADATGQQMLGAIDVASGQWLQNVPVTRGKNPAAFSVNNEVFVTITAPAATAADTTLCAAYGLDHRGCMAVFRHY